MELRNPYGFDTSDGYFGATSILNYHGEFHYVFGIFVSEEEYLEWFEANK